MKAIGYCILSGIIGFSLAVLFLVVPLNQRVADDSVRMCESYLIGLELISQDRVAELTRRRQEQLLGCAGMLSRTYRQHPGSVYFRWKIREYLISQGLPLTEEYFVDVPKERPMPSEIYYTGP